MAGQSKTTDIRIMQNDAFLDFINQSFETSDKAGANDTNDLDISNILYSIRVPLDLSSQADNVQQLFVDINDWEAWECARCEQAVQEKVHGGQLPSDNSVASKSKRNQYRVKVFGFLRTNSAWFKLDSSLRLWPLTDVLDQAIHH